MADVKIVDIDNSQWNMKDQEARNLISELKSEIQYKIVITEETINSDILLDKQSPDIPAYYNSLSINNRPTSDAILFQVSQIDEAYQGLIIAIWGKENNLLLSSETQLTILKGFKLRCFWLTPITK